MKKYTTLIVVLLVIMQVASWGGFMDNLQKRTVGLEEQKQTAHQYYEEGLYQKSIQQYDDVLAMEESLETRLAQIRVYAEYAKENPGEDEIWRATEGRMDTLISKYPRKTEGYEILAESCVAREEYTRAIEVLEIARTRGVKSDKLDELWQGVRYKFRMDFVPVKSFLPVCSGGFAVESDGLWGYVNEEGEQIAGPRYVYAGRFANGIAFVKEGQKNQLISSDMVVQVLLDGEYVSAGLYSDGVIPVSDGENVVYLDVEGNLVLGGYEQGGTFMNGKAMVKQNGEWGVIDKDGKMGPSRFSDVRLDFYGCFNQYSAFGAKQGEAFFLYSSTEGTPVGDFSCDDMGEIGPDGLVAFKKGDKWGFVNMEGVVVIEPAFDEAKSFSYGLAAVRQGESWGFVDADGTIVVDPQFEDVGFFTQSGTCFVKTEDRWRMMRFLATQTQ